MGPIAPMLFECVCAVAGHVCDVVDGGLGVSECGDELLYKDVVLLEIA